MGVMIRNVILDWSGTLCDDLTPVIDAFNAVLAEFGREPLDREAFRDRFCLPYARFYEQELGDEADGISLSDLENRFERHFDDSGAPVTVLEGAEDFLRYCEKTKRKLFILTSIRPSHYHRLVAELGLGDDRFEAVYAGARDKCETMVRLLEEQGLRPEETVMIGDMVHDIEAARAGGVFAAAVSSGYDSASRLTEAQPDVLAGSLVELRYLMAGPTPLETMPVSTVGALVFDEDDQVLLVRTVKWRGKWGIPGGKIQRGESAEAALKREILEETGLAIEDVRFTCVQDCIDSEEFREPAHFLLLNYTARVRGSCPEVRLNEEAVAWQWLPFAEAESLDLNIPTLRLVEAVRNLGADQPGGCVSPPD